jgi:hypothetical protein
LPAQKATEDEDGRDEENDPVVGAVEVHGTHLGGTNDRFTFYHRRYTTVPVMIHCFMETLVLLIEFRFED